MARIPLSQSNYTPIPDGEHTFTVKSVGYKEAFGNINIRFEIETGEQHTEFFSILNNNKALFAFTMTAKALMGDNNITDIDPNDLIGKSMVATSEQYIGSDGKTYVRLNDKKPVSTAAEKVSAGDSADTSDDMFAGLFGD